MSEPTSTDIQPITPEAKPPKAPKAKQPRARGSLLGWFNLLLILVLIGAVAAGGWYGWQHHNVLVAQLNAFKQAQGQQVQADQQHQQTQQKLSQQLAQQAQELQKLNSQSNYAIEQINKMAGADRQDWLVAEAEYLLRLANQRLQLERDWGSALAMLQAADHVLVEAGNPQLTTVRSHIANEILALRNLPAIDRQGAVLRIQSLQKAIPNLPWLPSKMLDEAGAPVQQAAQSEQSWYQELANKVSNSLMSLIRIRERSEANSAPLTPSQQLSLQQNMNLMLEQAQIALLREDQALYQHSLERVQEWIKHYLILEDSHTKAVQNSLQELQQWNIAPERPDISHSLNSLQKLIEQNRRGAVVRGEA